MLCAARRLNPQAAQSKGIMERQLLIGRQTGEAHIRLSRDHKENKVVRDFTASHALFVKPICMIALVVIVIHLITML